MLKLNSINVHSNIGKALCLVCLSYKTWDSNKVHFFIIIIIFIIQTAPTTRTANLVLDDKSENPSELAV